MTVQSCFPILGLGPSSMLTSRVQPGPVSSVRPLDSTVTDRVMQRCPPGRPVSQPGHRPGHRSAEIATEPETGSCGSKRHSAAARPAGTARDGVRRRTGQSAQIDADWGIHRTITELSSDSDTGRMGRRCPVTQWSPNDHRIVTACCHQMITELLSNCHQTWSPESVN